MPHVISIDLETHSRVNLRTDGAAAYARSPTTDILLFAWHLVGDPAPPSLWRHGEPFPFALRGAIANNYLFAGWNVEQFDRAVWRQVGAARYGWPDVPDDSWLDSMHRAAAANLPRGLAGAAKSVGVPFVEDLKDQARIRRITDKNITPDPSEEDLQWLADRCVQDVLMEEATLVRMPPWPDMRPWVNMPAISRRINDRGVLMDVPLVQGLARAARLETARLDAEMGRVTGGAVPATTQVERLKNWLVARGVELPRVEEKGDEEDEPDEEDAETEAKQKVGWRLRKSDIADLLARTDVPEDCRLALAMRAEAAKASTRKLDAMLRSADADGRLRGALVLGGAQQTLRWSGSNWQPHNFVRDTFANLDEVAEQNGLDVKRDAVLVEYLATRRLAMAIDVGRRGDPEEIRVLFGMTRKDLQGRFKLEEVLPFCSRMLRRTLTAVVRRMFMNGDFANIEARIPVWLAGQKNIVDAFARGDDVYRVTASPVLGLAPEKLSKEQRQIGKVIRLFMGFGGGVNAFVPAAMNYGISLSRAEGKPIVDGFRANETDLVAFWDNNLQCARWAVQNPGMGYSVPPLHIVSWYMDGSALCCELPSGRRLRYWAPRLVQGYWPDGTPKKIPDLTVLFVKGRAVFRRTLWRGLAVENVTQAIAADLLANALMNMDEAGMEVVLHVHDNVAAEVDEDKADLLLPVFKQAMLAAPNWTGGLPLAVAADISPRFG